MFIIGSTLVLLSFPLGGDPSFETKKDCGQAAMTRNDSKEFKAECPFYYAFLNNALRTE
jgi:hypothetical protein